MGHDAFKGMTGRHEETIIFPISTVDLDNDTTGRAPPGELLVALEARSPSERLIRYATRLATALDLSLTVLMVETPGPQSTAEPAELLALAAEEGATLAKLPAASLLDGAVAYITMSRVRHLVLSSAAVPGRRWSTSGGRNDPALADVDITWIATEPSGAATGTIGPLLGESASLLDYGIAVGAVLATAPLLLLLRTMFGEQGLGFLFVFPVLGVAARSGLRPALVAVALSTLLYDLLLFRSAAVSGAVAVQDVIVASALLIVAAYASALTARLRERVALSDRSAQENAALATFGTALARAADWESTGAVVSAEVAGMFGVNAAVFRERDGEMVLVAAEPEGASFGPLDQTALQWAWQQGEEAGSGASMAAAADWRFHPLRTSLGTLAVLAVARDDASIPIAPSRRLLFETLLAQAALAHERLRLEDLMSGRAS